MLAFQAGDLVGRAEAKALPSYSFKAEGFGAT